MVQCGIKRVVYLDVKQGHESEMRAVMTILSGAGVKIEAFRSLEVADETTIDELLVLKKKMYP